MEHYTLFLVMAVLLILTPGADTGLVTRNTLAYGKSGGGSTALGTSTGILVHTLAASLGLSAILAKSAMMFEVIKYIGAIYLLYLGIVSLIAARKNKSAPTVAEADIRKNSKSCFRQGVLTNVLNPKVAVFFLTFLPQFLDPARKPFLQLLGMGVTYAVLLVVWLFIYVYFISHIRQWMSKPSVLRSFEGITGFVLIGFGIKLALEKR